MPNHLPRRFGNIGLYKFTMTRKRPVIDCTVHTHLIQPQLPLAVSVLTSAMSPFHISVCCETVLCNQDTTDNTNTLKLKAPTVVCAFLVL
jgi:hypothetical protein